MQDNALEPSGTARNIIPGEEIPGLAAELEPAVQRPGRIAGNVPGIRKDLGGELVFIPEPESQPAITLNLPEAGIGGRLSHIGVEELGHVRNGRRIFRGIVRNGFQETVRRHL